MGLVIIDFLCLPFCLRVFDFSLLFRSSLVLHRLVRVFLFHHFHGTALSISLQAREKKERKENRQIKPLARLHPLQPWVNYKKNICKFFHTDVATTTRWIPFLFFIVKQFVLLFRLRKKLCPSLVEKKAPSWAGPKERTQVKWFITLLSKSWLAFAVVLFILFYFSFFFK